MKWLQSQFTSEMDIIRSPLHKYECDDAPVGLLQGSEKKIYYRVNGYFKLK